MALYKPQQNYEDLTRAAVASGKVYTFSYPGRPRCQKNDLMVFRFRNGSGWTHRIGHSSDFTRHRDALSDSLYGQYVSQGGKMPICYLFELEMKFFVTKQHEGDADNYPAAFLDAMQGHKITGDFVVSRVIENDRLLRRLLVHKIMPGDVLFHGEPRTEFTLRAYDLGKEGNDDTQVP